MTARSLRVLARSFAITALILIPGVIANAPRSPGAAAAAAAAASIGSVALFCLIVTGIALALASAVGQAVAAAPGQQVDTAAWLASRTRALSLARIDADARNFLLTFVIVGSVLLVGFIVGFSVFLGDERAGAAFSDVLPGVVKPYAAGVVSLATFGAVGLATSAYKELATLRVEAAHYKRQGG